MKPGDIVMTARDYERGDFSYPALITKVNGIGVELEYVRLPAKVLAEGVYETNGLVVLEEA